MKRQRTVVLGLVMAATMAFPAVAGAAGLDGVVQVGNTGPNSLMQPPPEPEPPRTTADEDRSQVVPCDSLNHRLPAFESALEEALN